MRPSTFNERLIAAREINQRAPLSSLQKANEPNAATSRGLPGSFGNHVCIFVKIYIIYILSVFNYIYYS